MKRLGYLVLLITLLLIFRKFFLPGPLVWGDAPYFYPQGLKELVNLPSMWIARGNSFGGVNLFLWIYPLMFLYGVLGTFLHFGNDLIIRILFYFPSLIFGLLGIFLLTRKLKFSKTITFFATLIYLVNTYYLLLIDGGQVGVTLAYGLFPLVLFFLMKLLEEITLNNFLIALVLSFLLAIVDFRIVGICFLTLILWRLKDWKKFWLLILLVFCLVGLSAYWVIPILQLTKTGISTDISGLQTTSLSNTLLLSSPNWPTNQFGSTMSPFFYFTVVPIFIFLPLFITKEKKFFWLVFIYLIFAFLAKGGSEPFGFLYTFFVNTRFGSVFRDSTKFFIPLTLVGGILIGISVENISKLLKGKKMVFVAQGAAFIFILLLVWQAFFGKMSGVLGKDINLSDYQKIYNLISQDSGFIRSAWYTERSPFAFHTEGKQAIDAKDLVNFRPFATINTGTGDKFNFMNNNLYLDWFRLLGIKYLVFSGNPRITAINKSDQEDWNRLLGLVSNDSRLQKLNIGTNVPVYENPTILPHEFFVDKTFIVLGSDDVYQKFKNIDNNFFVGNQGFLFPEDGNFDPSLLQDIASTSAIIIFNESAKNDLKMSFLQKDFMNPDSSYFSQWALRKPGDYLNWKYELLVNKIDTHSFDYNEGIAFSSVPNEELKYSLNAPEDGDYYLEIRSMSASGSGDLKVNFNNSTDMVKRGKPGEFEWYEKGPINLKAGNYTLGLQNTGGFQVVNTLALVPTSDMNFANQLTENFLGYFQHYDLNSQQDLSKLQQVLLGNRWNELQNGQVTKSGWIIYTDSYNSNWALNKINGDYLLSLPMYSMINGFYVNPKWGDVAIQFKGVEDLRLGVYFSVLSFLAILIFVLWKKSK